MYSAEIVKGRTRKDVIQGKSVMRLLVQIDRTPGLGSKVKEREVDEGVRWTHISDGRQVCFNSLFRRVA